MTHGRRPSVALARVCLAVCWAAISAMVAGPAAADEPVTLVRGALDLVCAARGRDDLERLGDRLLGGKPLHRPTVTNLTFGRRWTYPAADGRLILDWLWPRGQLPHFMVQYAGGQGSRPEVLAILDPRCALRAARRLLYDPDGLAEWLEDLDDTLQPNGHREPLNPPVPPHADPGGLPVAIIDTARDQSASRARPDGRAAGLRFLGPGRTAVRREPAPLGVLPRAPRHGDRQYSAGRGPWHGSCPTAIRARI